MVGNRAVSRGATSRLQEASVAVEPDGPVDRQPAPLEPWRPRLPRSLFEWWISGLVLFGVAGRLSFYTSPFGVPDSDEAVGGLMARDALHGHLTAFMWGQAYGGPLETWLAAPVVAVFGPTWLGLRLIPILLTVVACYLVWRVGLRTIGRTAALTAAAVCWFFPTTMLWKTTHFHILYASSMVLGLLTLLQVLRMRERPSWWGMFLLGLVAGVAVWQSFQLVTIVPVAIIWLVLRRRDVIRLLPATVLGALIGFLPVILSNLRNDWWSRNIGTPGDAVPYWDRVGRFFTNALPLALDLRAPITLHWFLWRPLGIALYIVVLAGFGWLVWRSRATRNRGLELLLVVAAAFPLIYAFSPLTSFRFHAGYVVVLMPVLALLLCAWITTEKQAMILSGMAVVLMATSTTDLALERGRSATDHPFFFFGDHAPLPRDFGPLIERLDELGLQRVYASYWIAYRLTYEGDGRIVAADIRPEALRTTPGGVVIPKPNDPDLKSRRPDYRTVVGKVAAPAFVIAKGFDVASTDYGAFESANYEKEQVGEFTIYHRGAASQGR